MMLSQNRRATIKCFREKRRREFVLVDDQYTDTQVLAMCLSCGHLERLHNNAEPMFKEADE